MRDIKFRLWDIEPKHFRQLDGRHDTFFLDRNGSISYYNLQNGSGGAEYIIEQYTGLKDKNGRDIYEGDILGDIYNSAVHWCDKCGGWELFYPEYGCMACNGDVHWYEVMEDSSQRVVVGNIHENEDLLN